MSTLTEIGESVRRVAAQAGPSVVGVATPRSHGSGVVVSPGKVLTNAHNLVGGEVTVTFPDSRTATATAAGVDVDGDVAVLDVDTGDAPAVSWDGQSVPDIGDPVFALANPGGRGPRVTFGLVTGTQRSFRGPRGRRIAGSFEHTAPLLPGSSGGPVTNEQGLLLGVNTNRLGEGFYLAIPADDSLRSRVDALGRGETPTRPRLGVAIAPAHVARGLRRAVGLPEVDGLLVRGVEEGSGADAAGLQEGDLIVAAAGRPLPDPDVLSDALSSASGSIELELVRGTETRKVTVTL